MELMKDKYQGAIHTITIGDPAKGNALSIGGQTTMPFLFDEGSVPRAPVIAYEIWDCEPTDWPEALKGSWKDALKDPVIWARAAKALGAKALCVRLQSVHQDWGNAPIDSSVETLKKIAAQAGLPLIVIGCGDDTKDNELMPKASQALKGTYALLGIATQNNYKTLAVTCLADGHSIVAESPIDVNIAKQLNILIGDMGFDTKRIVMHPTTASLGYGMEYVYSIMERARLAAFIGDATLSSPFIMFVGQESWRVKESKEYEDALGVNWEAATAVSMIQSGADILVMRHPAAAQATAKYIDSIMRR